MSKVLRATLVGALLVLANSSAASAQAEGGWWGDLYDRGPVPLQNILKKPLSFRGQMVSFVAQMHQLGTVDNPFFTKFESNWYLNFSVWPDETPLWKKSAYKSDFPYLFIKRDSPEAKVLLKTPTYARFIVVARVESVFKGRPWIEVTGLERLDTQMNEASLVHMVKGRTLRRVRRFVAAAQEFRAADADTLPPAVRLRLMSWEARAWAAAGKFDMAASRFESAAALAPDNKALQAELEHLRAQARKKGQPAPEPEKAVKNS